MKDIDFACTACGQCCHDLRLPLTLAEATAWLQRGGQMELLCEALPWPVEPEPGAGQAAYRRARSSPAMSGTLPVRISIVLAGAFVGACPNLLADMRCGIYGQRPLVCRIYPAEINPFVPLAPENKACPSEAWQGMPLQKNGILVDQTTHELVGKSRLANQLEAPQRMQLCAALGIDSAALTNEGFAIYSPERNALLTALDRVRDTHESHDDMTQWKVVSNRVETVNTLSSVGAAAYFVDTDSASTRHFRYHGFFAQTSN